MKSLFPLLLLFAVTAISAQSDKEKDTSDFKRQSVNLHFGASMPIGDFSEADVTYSESGYAKMGFYGGADLNYHFNPEAAVTFGYELHAFEMDVDAYDNLVEYELFFRGLSPDYLKTNVDFYYVNLVKLGYKASKNFNDISVSVEPYLGAAMMWKPRIASAVVAGGARAIVITEQQFSMPQLAYGLNLGINYQINSKIRIGLEGGWLAANAFKVETDRVFRLPGQVVRYEQEIDQAFSSLKGGLRLGYHF